MRGVGVGENLLRHIRAGKDWQEVEMANERKPDQLSEEEVVRVDDAPRPDRHAPPRIPRVEPLPQPIVIKPVPGEGGPEEPPG